MYGRLLAYVWVDGKMFNNLLLSEGYAQVATYPPNVKYVKDFTKIQEKTRSENKSFWKDNVSANSSNTPNTDTPKVSTYIGSVNSNKYHLPSCKHVNRIKEENKIFFNCIEEAIKYELNRDSILKQLQSMEIDKGIEDFIIAYSDDFRYTLIGEIKSKQVVLTNIEKAIAFEKIDNTGLYEFIKKGQGK